MNRTAALDAATTIVTGYVKRWMESNYDRLFTTASGRAAQSLEKPVRYAIEAGLYGLMVVIDRQLPDSSPAERLVKELLMDAPSEVAKRLINGGIQAASGDLGIAQEHTLRGLLNLDETTIADFLNWFAGLDHLVRQQVLELIRSLSPGELTSFLALPPALRTGVLSAVNVVTTEPSRGRAPSPSALHGLRLEMEKRLKRQRRKRP